MHLTHFSLEGTLMAKKETVEELDRASERAPFKYEGKEDRRRVILPQPDFMPYKKADAYPGTDYFFVGHSHNIEIEAAGHESQGERTKSVSALLNKGSANHHCVLVKEALADHNFYQKLSRFERDWLVRLPETTLIGPAVDKHGQLIGHCFSVWRKEMRKRS